MMTLPLAEIITNQVPSICISIYLHMRNNLKLSIFHYDEEHFNNVKKITWAGRAGKWFPSSSNTIFEWVGRHLQLTFGHIELICRVTSINKISILKTPLHFIALNISSSDLWINQSENWACALSASFLSTTKSFKTNKCEPDHTLQLNVQVKVHS